MRPLRVALIGGPIYDPLYESLPDFAARLGVPLEIAFQGDHPSLNRHLAQFDALPYDLVSSHSKYAPAHQHQLSPLEALLRAEDLADFLPTALALTDIRGIQYGLPRNIDVRLLHYRTDLLQEPPNTWDQLLDIARQMKRDKNTFGFVFPGKESGLFGTFFELCEMSGSSLFPSTFVPEIQNTGGRWALGFLRTLYSEGLVPPEIVDWHFDEVHRCFREGKAAMVGDWPSYYSLYQDRTMSAVASRFAVARYPVGPNGRSKSYGGGHSFALTPLGAARPEALALLLHLTAPAQQLQEAARGAVPVRRSIMGTVQAASLHQEQHRWQLLDSVIAQDILIPPKFREYPAVEYVLWHSVQDAMTGALEIDAALERMTDGIRSIVKSGIRH